MCKNIYTETTSGQLKAMIKAPHYEYLADMASELGIAVSALLQLPGCTYCQKNWNDECDKYERPNHLLWATKLSTITLTHDIMLHLC